MKKYYIAFAVLTLAVIAVVIYGFSVAGTPRQRRAAQMDSTRMGNLSSLSNSIEYYYEDNGKLPGTLSELQYSSYYSKDPETGEMYTYQKVTDTSYKLCANFSTDSNDTKDKDPYYDYYDSSPKTHKKGYDCINYDIPKSSQSGFMIPPSPVFYSDLSSATSRDARRLSDVRQLMTAFELFYNDCGNYPSSLTTSNNHGCPAGTTLGSYMSTIPVNPNPGGSVYTYTSPSPYATYTLTFSLEGSSGGFAAGAHTASPAGIN